MKDEKKVMVKSRRETSKQKQMLMLWSRNISEVLREGQYDVCHM